MNVLRRLTWKMAGVTLVIAVGLHAWLMVETATDSTPADVAASNASLGIIHFCMACCVLLATLAADEAVDRGARRFSAYGTAVILGCAIAALVQFQAHRWLQWPTRLDLQRAVQTRVHFVQPMSVFLEYLLWCTIAVTVYVNRRSALQASARLKATQAERARSQRRMLESRLQALQARVEPQFLFGTLKEVQRRCDIDPAQGNRMLDDLIVYLRAALPELRDPGSTLGQELRLATAYLRIRQQPQAEGVGLDVPGTLLPARLPPMLLLPLIDLLQSTAVAPPIRITARAADGVLRIEVAADRGDTRKAPPPPGLLRDIDERLRLLCGERARLRLDERRDTIRILLSLPHEPTDGDHR
jgi:hypothetical protein